MGNDTRQAFKKQKIFNLDHESKSADCFNAADAKLKRSKFGMAANNANNPKGEEHDIELLRKIDFFCFVAYLLGYILFNIIYWAKMMAQ